MNDVIAGRYDLAGVLGSGAETIVFRARDLLTGDEVAVKVFRASALQNLAAVKAFQRDLAVLRDKAHPNVVRVFDFGETDGGFYTVVELMHGAPLSRHITGRRWSHEAALELLEQVSSALAWLHSHEVVHGDIRTANIVWNDGIIKLMDFGPQRDSRQATAASDLYSAAAVIYDLVAGEPSHAAVNRVERVTSLAPGARVA